MRQDCLARFNTSTSCSRDYNQHKFDTSWFDYMQDIASKIGATPNMLYLALTDPRLAYACLFGPLLNFQYRLNGPHSWNGAARTILSVHDRVRSGFNTGAHYEASQRKNSSFPIFKVLFGCSLLCIAYRICSRNNCDFKYFDRFPNVMKSMWYISKGRHVC